MSASHAWLERIRTVLEKDRAYAVSLLQSWVQEKSVQGQEAGIQRKIAQLWADLGLEVDVWTMDGEELRSHPYFISSRTSFADSPNVAAIWRGAGGGRSLLLNGHVDVVPVGDETQWSVSPFGGEYRDGKLYGRGSTDMKGGNLSAFLAVKALRTLGVRLKGDVILQSVVEEESGGAGTLSAIQRGYRADAALIPEPTNLKLFPRQQGSMWFRIRVRGRSAHGGTRYEGVSAIEKSMLVIQALQRLELERKQRMDDPLFTRLPIPVPINVGVIRGGEWPSSVCDLVVLEGRMGVAPKETLEEARQEMKEALHRLALEDEWFLQHPAELEWFGARWVPGGVEEDHPFLAVLQTSYRSVMGQDAQVEASPWGTDGGLLTKVGQTPAIVFGPGVTSVAHHPDEYIEMDDVFRCAEIIALAILEWCGVDG